MLLIYLIISVLILAFVLYVEDLYRFNVEPDGHELTEPNNKVVWAILSFIPIIQYVVCIFFIVKYIIYRIEYKHKK